MATLDNVLQERNGLRPETARCQAVIGGNVTVLREASSLSGLQAEWSEISRKFQKSLAGFCTHTHTHTHTHTVSLPQTVILACK